MVIFHYKVGTFVQEVMSYIPYMSKSSFDICILSTLFLRNIFPKKIYSSETNIDTAFQNFIIENNLEMLLLMVVFLTIKWACQR